MCIIIVITSTILKKLVEFGGDKLNGKPVNAAISSLSVFKGTICMTNENRDQEDKEWFAALSGLPPKIYSTCDECRRLFTQKLCFYDIKVNCTIIYCHILYKPLQMLTTIE